MKLTFESNDKKITYEMGEWTNMEDLLDVFFSGCIGLTYMPDTILKNMKLYADSKLDVYGWNNNEEGA
jgi:hypothetical protein